MDHTVTSFGDLRASLASVLLLPLFALGSPSLAAQERLEVGDLGRTFGDADAPIQVVEFTDPSCPYCAQFHSGIRDSLFHTYVEKGKAVWITLPYVSDQFPNSEVAARVIECADRADLMKPMLDVIFEQRDAWVGARTSEARSKVLAWAVDIGVPTDGLEACVDSAAIADRVARVQRLALESGVRGTPTYFVDGFPAMGAVPFGFAKRIFDRRLEQIGIPRIP